MVFFFLPSSSLAWLCLMRRVKLRAISPSFIFSLLPFYPFTHLFLIISIYKPIFFFAYFRALADPLRLKKTKITLRKFCSRDVSANGSISYCRPGNAKELHREVPAKLKIEQPPETLWSKSLPSTRSPKCR